MVDKTTDKVENVSKTDKTDKVDKVNTGKAVKEKAVDSAEHLEPLEIEFLAELRIIQNGEGVYYPKGSRMLYKEAKKKLDLRRLLQSNLVKTVKPK